MQANHLISEWTSPDFHQAAMIPYLASVLLLLFTLGFSKKRLLGWELLTVVWFTYFAFTSRRQIGPYVYTVMPVLGRYGWDMLADWGDRMKAWHTERAKTRPPSALQAWLKRNTMPDTQENKTLNLALVLLLALVAAGKLVYVANPVFMEHVYLPSLYPVQAVQWIREAEFKGNLFNEYGQGGYLSWFLPEYPVYIDARADLFGDAFILNWVDLVNGAGNWEETVETWEIGVVLIAKERKLAQELHNSSMWELIGEDLGNVLYIKIEE
jgi:hypothetical protein